MRLASALTSSFLAGMLVLSGTAAVAAPEDIPAVEAAELTSASSLLALINPSTKLSPEDYTPKDLVTVSGTSFQLRKQAADAVQDLVADARAAGHSIKVLSAFRSYQRQATLFNQYQAQYGTDYAERISARPGTSEHQLGLAADLGYTNSRAELKEAFGQTPAGQWIAEHAVDYGLIVRYPVGKEEITGYKYEPWHVRYIGKEQAKAMQDSGAETYEEYFGMLQEASRDTAASPAAKPSAEPSNEPRSEPSTPAGPAADKDNQKVEGSGVLREDDLMVLRFLPPYRDWSFGFTK
ncbi:M15 family metallopeptidase [Glutamicibacter protophormiae]|uniref:M15 family metallopeptidase n=1 Tax=Glutamicibacter protophormiae TaxID=37930 RepID=UPI002A80C4F9|nr:M15 family metallopeptidase [Glutamicibacter protophormiae]WPR63867.1 M15 family metallopeptidase [Glutamicibacter protophormiae]WPR67362.1 M15 family metallopeptidase [Glutamicibacter protophormiae]